MKNRLFLKSFLTTVILGFGTLPAWAELNWENRSPEIIDSQTADIVDHYGYYLNFRFGSEGNLQNKTVFGVFPRLNIGFGLDGEQILGTSDEARLNKPTINGKFRFFDGKGFLPALAMGYDGQGYEWNKNADEYEQKELGFYLTGTTEIIVPEFLLTLGVNNFDFSKGNSTRAFWGTSYTYQHTLGAMFEWMNVTEYEERRLNFGLKYFITPLFSIDAIGRDIPKSPVSDDRVLERIIRLNYSGSF